MAAGGNRTSENRSAYDPAADAVKTTLIDGVTGQALGAHIYQLASNQSLASGANTISVTGVVSGSYIWNVVGTFSGGSTVTLQALGADGATWVNVTKSDGTAATVSASGNVGVVIGNNASLRLLGGVATTTNLYSSLS